MGKSSNKQSGTGLLSIILAIVVLGALVGVGLYVFKHNKKAAVAPATSNSNIQTAQSKPRKTLLIKEWGLQMEVPSTKADVIYVMQNPDADGAQRLNFSYQGLAELDASCSLEKSIDQFGLGPFGTIVRYTASSTMTIPGGQKKTVAEVAGNPSTSFLLGSDYRFHKVGSDYYYLSSGYAPYCGSSESKTVKDFLENNTDTTPGSFLENGDVQKSIRSVN